MMNSEQFDDLVRSFEYDFARYPVFAEVVAIPWFKKIAPERSAAYGIEGLLRFGQVGVFYQIANCYYRWKTYMEKNGSRAVAIADTLRDMFGYSILMAAVESIKPTDVDFDWIVDRHPPEELFETLLDNLIHDASHGVVPVLNAQLAMSLAYNAFSMTRKEYKNDALS
jgi:hypothetical protein